MLPELKKCYMPAESQVISSFVADPFRYSAELQQALNLYHHWSAFQSLPVYPFFADLYVLLLEGPNLQFTRTPAKDEYTEQYEYLFRRLAYDEEFLQLHKIIRTDKRKKGSRAQLALLLLLRHLPPSPMDSRRNAIRALHQIIEDFPFTPSEMQMVANEHLFPSRASLEGFFAIEKVKNSLPARIPTVRIEVPPGEEPIMVEKASHLPLGGYTELSTDGSFESIVPTELAYLTLDEKYFLWKFVNGELLYFSRDTEAEILVLVQVLVLGCWLNPIWSESIYSFGGEGMLGKRLIQGLLCRVAEDFQTASRGKLRVSLCLIGQGMEEEAPRLQILLPTGVSVLGIDDPEAACPTQSKYIRGKLFTAFFLSSPNVKSKLQKFVETYYDRYSLIDITREKLKDLELLQEELIT